ncbi:hypothetical protein CEUSTIGMA_g12370.t1 [Chlamydomonas eustigma]|uniref:RNA-binding protein n=1 Tax=Chlamydomonas eustigma TaxID=1157962 RepID=A0A250XPS3_9CHLO|nr:hypothetical protein CEUSTIGMA_g12370.t1 [Chlamydomonas eustigma]|eukprot:GAX84949.1 hypothetical protein CEUSTIGMA_g12370.t1 [Chlamydomonas eustigma]
MEADHGSPHFRAEHQHQLQASRAPYQVSSSRSNLSLQYPQPEPSPVVWIQSNSCDAHTAATRDQPLQDRNPSHERVGYQGQPVPVHELHRDKRERSRSRDRGSRWRLRSRSSSSSRRRRRSRSHSRDRSRRRGSSRDNVKGGGRYRSRSSSREEGAYEEYHRERESRRRRNERLAREAAAGLDGEEGERRGSSRDRDTRRRSRRSRSRSRSRSYSSEDDGGRQERYRREGSVHYERRGRPSCTVYIKNLPMDYTESEISRLLDSFPNITSVRLGRERSTGRSKGYAFVDFTSEADSAKLIEYDECNGLYADSHKLVIEYSISAPASSAAAPLGNGAGGSNIGNSLPLDWICPMCQSVNFARRLECYQCSAVRPADPQRVHPDADGPSSILKISGLDSNVSEETLLKAFSAQAPVIDVRLVLDKYTGAPRGFGFVQFNDISDATRAMNALQGVSLPGGSRLRLCYARDRMVPTIRGSTSTVAQDALQAAAAMQQYSGWEPKEFGAVQEEEAAPKPEEQPAAAGIEGSSASPGFVYDSASGYWYDAASGYYYDANTSLYYHPSAQQWYSYNAATGEYTAAGGGSSSTGATAAAAATPSSASGLSNAAQGAISTMEAAVSAASARSAASASAAAAQKKRGAVIGSAPHLNSQGLMAAVQQLQEKEMHQKALAAQKASQQKQQQQKLGGGTTTAAVPGPVQGVIHKGKWAARTPAAQ